MTTITRVNIYKSGGEWCYAAWTADEFDVSDTLGCPDDASENDALREAAKQFSDATINRIHDVAR